MDGLMVDCRVDCEAARRLRAYFRTFGFDDPAVLSRLTERILAQGERSEPAEIALTRAARQIEAWFVDILGPAIVASGAVEAIGRAAFLLAGAAQRWPQHFLEPSEPPAEMVAALRRAAPAPIPLAAIAMPEQSLAFPWPANPLRHLLRKPASDAPRT